MKSTVIKKLYFGVCLSLTPSETHTENGFSPLIDTWSVIYYSIDPEQVGNHQSLPYIYMVCNDWEAQGDKEKKKAT